MFGVRYVPVCLVLTALWSFSPPVLADELHVRLHPESTGPFPGGVGGQIPYSVSVEIVDVEADGYDSQGIHGLGWDVFTDTGLTQPESGPALTGETGIFGPADVSDMRYLSTSGTDELFVGGYAFDNQFGPFAGNPSGDDLLDVWALLPGTWPADVEPNVPGLQPLAMAGIGIGERPPGGLWVLAGGTLSYPAAPGDYTVGLTPAYAQFIRSDVDLTQDQGAAYYEAFAAEDIFGDSFSFTVLPEPAALLLLAAGVVLLRRK